MEGKPVDSPEGAFIVNATKAGYGGEVCEGSFEWVTVLFEAP
jgi:hypothetical protein